MNNKTDIEDIKQKIDKEKEEFKKKVDDLIDSFEYYHQLVENLYLFFTEYEINDKIICYTTCEVLDKDNKVSVSEDDLSLNIDYIIRVIYEDNILQFYAVDFKNKDTKFKITKFNANRDNEKIEYTLDNIDNVKNDIIEWLISI
jgi:hypothetical protein